MRKKYIQISINLIEDLIYGRLRPATSDAPEGLKIKCVYHPRKREVTDFGIIDVVVEHESFEEVPDHIEMQQLKVTFTKTSDNATRDLVKRLRGEMICNKEICDKAAKKIEDMFVENDKQTKRIFDYMMKDEELRSKLDNLINIARDCEIKTL